MTGRTRDNQKERVYEDAVAWQLKSPVRKSAPRPASLLCFFGQHPANTVTECGKTEHPSRTDRFSVFSGKGRSSQGMIDVLSFPAPPAREKLAGSVFPRQKLTGVKEKGRETDRIGAPRGSVSESSPSTTRRGTFSKRCGLSSILALRMSGKQGRGGDAKRHRPYVADKGAFFKTKLPPTGSVTSAITSAETGCH